MWRRIQRTTSRVRGRWVISWQAYSIGVVLHVALVAGSGGSLGAEPTPVGQTPYWLLLAIVASGVVGLYALLVNYTLFRYKRRRLVPLWQAIAFHIGVGVLFAIVLFEGSRHVPVTPITGAIGFALATVSIGVWFGFTMSFLLQAREQYHINRAELIEQTVRAELASIAETEAMAVLTASFHSDLASSLAQLEPIREELSDRLQQTRSATTPINMDASWQAVAHRLRSASEQSVRPLSHELWTMAEVRYPNPTWREVLVDTLRSPIAWAWPSALIVVIGYLRGSVTSFGIVAGLVVTVALASLIGAMLKGVSAIRSDGLRGLAFWLSLLIAQGLGLAVVLVDATTRSDGLTNELAGSVIAMGISVFAPAAVRTLNNARNGVLDRLERDSAQERITQIARGRHVARLARDAASHLHGTVQTSLIACAAAIDLAVEAEDADGLIAALEYAAEIVASAGVAASSADHTVRHAVDRSVSAWQGLVDITVHVDPDAEFVVGSAATAAGRVFEECIANAVRHGDAANITIVITRSIDELQIVVTDDGGGLDGGSVQPGLGTSLLVEATTGRVSIQNRWAGGERSGVEVHAVIDLTTTADRTGRSGPLRA